MEVLIAVFIGICIYFIPAITAHQNKKKNRQSIYIINFFLGWTLIGWVVALSMAVSKDENKNIVIHKENNISTTDEIEKLSNLKEKGILSEEEFQAKKKKLLEM